jgi:hypothetical protein
MPSEKTIERRIIGEIKKRGGVVVSIHGTATGARGFPDLIGGLEGRPFALEVKKPGEPLTPLQRWWLQHLKEQGYITLRVVSVKDFVKQWSSYGSIKKT